MGGKSTTTVTHAPPSPQEQALISIQTQLAQQQLAEIQRQSAFQQQAFEQFKPLIDSIHKESERQAARAKSFEPIQDEVLNMQLEALRRGGAASPQQMETIRTATDAALAAGEVDIDRFQTDANRRLRDELANSLGLRPTDSPVLDRGAQIGAEAVRQKGQLAQGLRSAQATATLDYPLAVNQMQAGIGLSQQQLLQSASEFSKQLSEAAFLNRLSLVQGQGQLGLGLATGINSGIGQTLSTLAGRRGQTTTTKQSMGIGSILGGVGGLFSALPGLGFGGPAIGGLMGSGAMRLTGGFV